MVITKLHVYELPESVQGKMHCRLDEAFRKEFFNKVLVAYETKTNLAKILGVSENIVYGWINGKNIRGKKRIISIPIKSLFSLCESVGIHKEEAERKIISLKAKGALSKELVNPALPIPLGYEMGRLIGISLGDGYLTKTGTIVYSNTEATLIKEAMLCARKLGDVQLEHNTKNNYLLMPAAIGYILHGLGVPLKAKTKSKMHLPQIIFDGSREFQFGVLSGLFDDEGSVVKDGKIVFEQNMENVVKDVKALLDGFGIETSDVQESTRRDGKIRYSFNLRGGVHIRKHLLDIGLFKHPKKIERLESINVKRIISPRKGTKVPALYEG